MTGTTRASSLADAPPSPHASSALGQENRAIGEYGEAMVDWADAPEDALHCHDQPDNPWRRIADIPFAGNRCEQRAAATDASGVASGLLGGPFCIRAQPVRQRIEHGPATRARAQILVHDDPGFQCHR